jgi:hypothetical protein
VLLMSGCIGARGGSPAASALFASGASSASAASTPSASPDDAVARAPVHLPPWTDAGSMATVLTPRLAVRDFAGSIFDKLTELRTGTEVFVAFGPLANEGLDWYEGSCSPPSPVILTTGATPGGAGLPPAPPARTPPSCGSTHLTARR